MSQPIIREAREDDLDEVLATLRLALGESPILRRTPELWAWKHVLNPFGRSIVLVSEAEGAIAGVRALMRWTLRAPDGTAIRCVRPVDTATHPGFTRRGIFRSLTMAAMETARADGVDLIFNTPNHKSGPGYFSMGWSHVSWIGVQARLRLGEVVPPPDREPPMIDVMAPDLSHAESIPDPDPESQPPRLTTMMTPGYFDWRFRRHPTASYGWMGDDTDSGGVVARASTRGRYSELVISHVVGNPSPRVIGRIARAARTRYLAGWFSPGSRARSIAIRGGLLPIPRARTLRLVALPLIELAWDPLDLASWQLSTSDLELL